MTTNEIDAQYDHHGHSLCLETDGLIVILDDTTCTGRETERLVRNVLASWPRKAFPGVEAHAVVAQRELGALATSIALDLNEGGDVL